MGQIFQGSTKLLSHANLLFYKRKCNKAVIFKKYLNPLKKEKEPEGKFCTGDEKSFQNKGNYSFPRHMLNYL